MEYRSITEIIEAQEDKDGVDIDAIDVGTLLEVQTQNTLYKIRKVQNRVFEVQGGKYFPSPIETQINGSTWGGSMLRIKWLGIDMYMEIIVPGPKPKLITTSSINSITITAPDTSWSLTLEQK